MGLSLNSLYEQGHYPTTLVHVNCCTDKHTCDEQNFLLYTELYVTLSYDDFIFIVLMLDNNSGFCREVRLCSVHLKQLSLYILQLDNEKMSNFLLGE